MFAISSGALASSPAPDCAAAGAAVAPAELSRLAPLSARLTGSDDLEGMSSLAAAKVLEADAVASDAVALAAGLSDSKLARVLPLVGQDILRSAIIKAIGARAARVLLFAKEAPGDEDPDGTHAHAILAGLDARLRAGLLAEVAAKDPRYAAAIKAWAPRDWSAPDSSQPPAHLERTAVAAPSARPPLNDELSIPDVSQREYLITTASEHPKIETTGLAPCIAVTLWDPATKTGLLAHIDAPTHIEDSLDRVLLEFEKRGISPERLQARLVGGEDPAFEGDQTSSDDAYTIERRLTQAGIAIVQRDLLGKDSVRNLIFDLEDGRAYDLRNGLHGGDEAKGDRLWDSHKRQKFCDGYLYRHEDSLPSVGVSTEQYESARQCY